jgi:hypothetical protein
VSARAAYPLDMRRPLAAALLTVASLLALAGPASPASAPFNATLRAPTHSPKANALWRITVTAKSRSGKSLRATADYQFLLHGQVVARSHPSPATAATRRGRSAAATTTRWSGRRAPPASI